MPRHLLMRLAPAPVPQDGQRDSGDTLAASRWRQGSIHGDLNKAELSRDSQPIFLRTNRLHPFGCF